MTELCVKGGGRFLLVREVEKIWLINVVVYWYILLSSSRTLVATVTSLFHENFLYRMSWILKVIVTTKSTAYSSYHAPPPHKKTSDDVYIGIGFCVAVSLLVCWTDLTLRVSSTVGGADCGWSEHHL